nr:hypothetical protein [Tanacetum cinerariifolium]
TSNTNNPNTKRIDTMPSNDTTNATTTTNVARNVVEEDNDNLPQLIDSRGGSHVINILDSDFDVEEDNRTNNEFMANLNAEYQERALLANQKRFDKRHGRVGSARKPLDKSKETCFTCGKLGHF